MLKVMADDELIDKSGTVHERTWTGEYRAGAGLIGEQKDVNLLGQPNVRRDIFGNPQVKRDFWGQEVHSDDGQTLYVRSGSHGRTGSLEGLAGTWVGLLVIIGLAILIGLVIVYFIAVRKLIRLASERLLRLALGGHRQLGGLLPPNRDLLPRHGAIADVYVNCAAVLTMAAAPVLIALLVLLTELPSPGPAAGGWIILAIVIGLSLAVVLGTASTLPVARLGHLGGVLGALGLIAVTVLAVATLSAAGNALTPGAAQSAAQTVTQPAGIGSTSVIPTVTPTASVGDATDELAIQQIFSAYFNAVNNHDYDTAWAQYTPQEQTRLGSEQQYVQGEATTHVTNMTVQEIVSQSGGVDLATITFTSTQDPANSPDGQACDNWSLVYTMVHAGSSWFIDRAVSVNGVAYRPC
jgi:hypothetical protein